MKNAKNIRWAAMLVALLTTATIDAYAQAPSPAPAADPAPPAPASQDKAPTPAVEPLTLDTGAPPVNAEEDACWAPVALT